MSKTETSKSMSHAHRIVQFEADMMASYGEEFRLTAAQIEELRQCFLLFDKSGSGSIDCTELKLVFESMGHHPTPTEIDMMIKEVDEGGDMEIDFREFISFMHWKMRAPLIEEDYVAAFKIFDKSKRGFIGTEEFYLIMTQLGEHVTKEEVAIMLQDIDKDENGMVGLAEFKKYCVQQFVTADEEPIPEEDKEAENKEEENEEEEESNPKEES